MITFLFIWAVVGVLILHGYMLLVPKKTSDKLMRHVGVVVLWVIVQGPAIWATLAAERICDFFGINWAEGWDE